MNDTGDGFVLIDEAGGAGTLEVNETGEGSIAADLRLLGPVVVGGDGKDRIVSRLTTTVDVDSEDTLDDLVEKINEAGGRVTASVFDDGSAFNSKRLLLTSSVAGFDGRIVVDDGGIGLGLETFTAGQDALLQVGETAETGFLVASDSNSFTGAATNLDVDVHKVGTTPARVTVSLDTSKVRDLVTGFVRNYNSFVDTAKTLTKFNAETGERGVLQGQGFVLRSVSRLESLVTRRHLGSGKDVRSLIDLGVRIGTGGKLIIDASQLNAALDDHPDAVAKFFLDLAEVQPETGELRVQRLVTSRSEMTRKRTVSAV